MTHPNEQIAFALFGQAVSELKRKVMQGECRSSMRLADWLEPLPPLEPNEAFPWIGQAEPEIKPKAKKQLAMF